ncbi:MAG: hypothetical protein ACYC7D_00555 [Nitrososphaerales archaeon]
MTQAARKNSVVGVPGVYASAYNDFPIGKLFLREIQLRMGQCPVKKYNERFMQLIEEDRVDTTAFISTRMELSEAAKAYEIWDRPIPLKETCPALPDSHYRMDVCERIGYKSRVFRNYESKRL